MKVPEEAVEDALVKPFKRLLALFIIPWLIGGVYPTPVTIFYLIKGPTVVGNASWTHTPTWFDFGFMPVIGTLFSQTVLVSGPIAVFCVICSVLDRWNWIKVTALLSFTTLSMNFLDDFSNDAGWVILSLLQAATVSLLFVLVRPLREP